MLVGITDAGGNLIARYSYDEWGKLLSIEPAEEDNEEQLSIAQLNPLRYRGYYYDTESGLYYINSRYYSPELCRFISSGDYSSIDSSNKHGLNAYSYCYNSPAAFSNYDGIYKSSVDTAEIKQFLKNSIKVIKTLSDEFAKALGIDKENIKKKANQILDKTKKFFDNMISRYNTFIDKLEYAINYPDAVINNVLSKIFNKDVNIRFRIIEYLRKNNNLSIDLSKFKFEVDKTNSPQMRSRSSSSSDKDNVAMAVFQGLVAAIELDWFDEILQTFNSGLDKIFKEVTDSTIEFVSTFLTSFNVILNYCKDSLLIDIFSSGGSLLLEKGEKMALENASDFVDAKGTKFGFNGFLTAIKFICNIDSAGSGSTFSRKEDIVISVLTLAIDVISIFLGNVAAFIVPAVSSIIIDVTSLRLKGYILEFS